MSVDYNITVLTDRLQVVADAIDAGATNGSLSLLTITGTLLSTLELARPCGVAFNGVLTFSGMALIDPAATGGGFARRARVSDGDGTIIISGLTVSDASSAEVVLTPTSFISPGQTVAITQASITGN